MGNVLALGWERHVFGLSQLRAGCWEGKGGSTFFPAAFLPLALAGWSCSPGSPHPCSHQCMPMLGWHSHPPACMPASIAPHAITVSPWACLARWLWCWLWTELGVPLPSLLLQQHSCHQARGLVPEPCKPLQPCHCLGTPSIQGLVLGASCTHSQG